MNVSQSIKNMNNEVRSLKVVQPINGGALTQHAVSISYEGEVDMDNPISTYSLLAAFEVTFTRTDGINKPPLVQFGFSVTPDDQSGEMPNGTIIELAENYAVFKICLPYFWWPFEEETIGTISLECQAYSPVPGEISIERVYS